ncbi:MAG: winged helix-turn-helix domain-containing protein [Desulfurococcaceae archaeon]
MSKKRRELLEVYYDVLKELRRNPMRITYLMRKCNIDTRMAKQVIGALMSKGLIVSKNEKKYKLYYITEKGARFLELYESLQELLKK